MNKFLCCVISSILLITINLSALDYTIQDIGTLQTDSSHPLAINSVSQILGWYNIDGSTDGKHYFLRDHDGSFHELPSKTPDTDLSIDWRFLTDNGQVYGTYDYGNYVENPASNTLYMWDIQNGLVNLGVLPKGEIKKINNAGQVLIASVTINENGKTKKCPVIWQNGAITTLKCLEGDIGIESDESEGFDMNNQGEVVGRSITYLSYKNKLYKQTHAVKWINGQPIDLHELLSKCPSSIATTINDLGDIVINGYLIRVDGTIQNHYKYSTTKATPTKYFFSTDYYSYVDRFGKDYGVSSKEFSDKNCIWRGINRVIAMNDNGEVVAEGITVYGEIHALLFTPAKVDTENAEGDNDSIDNQIENPTQDITKEILGIIINDTVDASFLYHTDEIASKVEQCMSEAFVNSHNNGYHARQVSDAYRRTLMLEALDNILEDTETLALAYQCEHNIWFWETVQRTLKNKSNEFSTKVDAYIKMKMNIIKR